MSRRIALVLLSLAMTFGVAEVGFRVYDASTRRATLAGRDPDTLDTEAVDDARIYRMRPNRKGLTNGHGFRDLPRTRRKAEGTYRIAVIGDSVTMQATIDFDDLYPTRLQRALNERLPDASIEVLNFGVSGYSTRQQLAVLRAEVLSFEPDALLWQFHLNDAVDPLVDGADGGLGRYHARPRSAFLAYLQRRWHRLHRKRIARAHGLSKIHSDFQHQVARWDDVSTAFGEVAELAAEHGFEVFIFLYPTWPDTDWDEFSPEGFDVVDSLVRRFESLGFATLDLVGVFRSESPARYRAAADDPWHPNRAGHARIADELARWLVPMISRYGASGGAGDTDAPDRPGDDGPVPHGMMPMSDADTRDDD